MPTEAPALPACTWLAGCIVHRNLPFRAPEVDVKINGMPFRAILDSDSVVSLVLSHILAPRMECETFLPRTPLLRQESLPGQENMIILLQFYSLYTGYLLGSVSVTKYYYLPIRP